MIELWTGSRPITPVLYLNDAMPSVKLVVILQLLSALVAAGLFLQTFRGKFNRFGLLFFAGLIQAFQYLYYCAYVDEVYVNLEHSWNLYHFGKFSFNPISIVDGTVELFYYAILAPFAWSHIALVYACIGLGLIIALLHTLLVWYFVRNFSNVVQFTILAAFAWNPIFAEIQSAGFGNGLVSLIYLLGFIAVWENRLSLAGVCAAILPLIRPDAVVYSLFLIIAITLKHRKIPFKTILFTAASVGVFMIIVHTLYGHWILTPILFKKTPFSEILRGLGPQMKPALYGLFDVYTCSVVGLICISTLQQLRPFRPEIDPDNRRLIHSQLLLMFFLYLFYILTNRNFFAETRRYYMPIEYLGIFLVLSEWGLPYFKKLKSGEYVESENDRGHSVELSRSYLLVGLLLLFIWCINSSVVRWKDRLYRSSDRTNQSVAWLIDREDVFSVQSAIAKQLVPNDWRIAATELQGFGYLLDHEIDPLYGYANRRMAMSKTLASRGTKTDVTYLFDSKPEIISTENFINYIYPYRLSPERQPYIIAEMHNNLGFNILEIVRLYPHIFIIQVVSSKGTVVDATFLVRDGLENEFRNNLREHQYTKTTEIKLDLDQFKKWASAHPFNPK